MLAGKVQGGLLEPPDSATLEFDATRAPSGETTTGGPAGWSGSRSFDSVPVNPFTGKSADRAKPSMWSNDRFSSMRTTICSTFMATVTA